MERRAKLYLLFALSAIVLVVVSRPLLHLLPYRYDKGETFVDELSPERIKLMQPERLVSLMNPRPGSTVVDVGAGYGMFTFRLARAVGREGKVYATDVDPAVITYLSDQARIENTPNVIPVKVRLFGLDPFYTQHIFDMILLSDVLPDIAMPEQFVRKLRPALKKESGRMWVIMSRPDPDFSEFEFTELADLPGVLRSDRVRSSIGARLRTETMQSVVERWAGRPDRLASRVAGDLNALLNDPKLWPEARDSKWPLSKRYELLIQGLGRWLEKQGVFGQNAGPITGNTLHAVRLLNRLIIVDLLGMKMWSTALVYTDISHRDAAHTVDTFESQLTPYQLALSIFKAAGYELVKEHAISPYHFIFEFQSRE